MSFITQPPATDWLSLTRLEQVLYLANLGYKILPVYGIVGGRCTCGSLHEGKKNSAGKHPSIAEWQDKATTDATQLAEWFTGHDELNYGIYMAGSGVVAIDIDVEGGGWNSWFRLDAACEGEFPETVQVRTGRKLFQCAPDNGAHLYFKAGENLRYPANLTKVGFPSIDLRHKAFVLGPGSMHQSGIRYEWEPGHAPWEIEVREVPEIALGYLMPTKAKTGSQVSDSSIGDDDWKAHWSNLAVKEVKATPYAKTALANAAKELSAMLPGSGRNNALNAKAFSMGRLVGGGQISLEEAKTGLRSAIEISYGKEFLTKHAAVEITLRTWGGGFEVGAMEPKFPNEISEERLEWIRMNYTNPAKPDETVGDLIEVVQEGFFKGKELQRETLEMAVRSFGPIEVGPGKTIWSYADGYWKQDGREVVIARTGRLLGEAARSAHTQTLIHFIEVEEPKIKDLGPERYLNLKNGMLDWRTGVIEMYDPCHYSTVQLPVTWNPDAKCPTVDKFLEEVLDPELVELIWEVIGICIYTGMGFHIGIFFDGSGRNGKGTLIRLIQSLVPDQFTSHVELNSINKDKFAKAQLFNKILNVVGDLSPTALNDVSMFKQLTGDDTITADFKYGQSFNFKNEATMLFATNEMPYVRDTTFGLYERMLIIPFDKVSLSKEQVDKTLEPRMALELEGVLVKAVEGLRRAKSRGHLKKVKRCEDALAKFRMGSFWLNSWAEKTFELTSSPSDRVRRSDLYELYKTWAGAEGLSVLSKADFKEIFLAAFEGKTKFVHQDGNEVFNHIRLLDK